jgi:hypothetical protein
MAEHDRPGLRDISDSEFARLINPRAVVEARDEVMIQETCARLSKVMAILLFKLGDNHRESVKLLESLSEHTESVIDELWDMYAERRIR